VFRSTAAVLDAASWHEQFEGFVVSREPYGVVGATTPWDFPVDQIAAKVAPALGAGCTIVLKPSEVAPLNAVLLAEVLDAVGFPAGAFISSTASAGPGGARCARDPGSDARRVGRRRPLSTAAARLSSSSPTPPRRKRPSFTSLPAQDTTHSTTSRLRSSSSSRALAWGALVKIDQPPAGEKPDDWCVVKNEFSRSRLKWARPSGRPRVFIEDADLDRYRIAARALTDAHYQVGPFCGGSHFHEAVFQNRPVPNCPLIKTGSCTLLEPAQVIVFRYDLESPENRLVLELIRHKHPETPVVVETSPDWAGQLAPLLEDCDVVDAPATLDGILAAVDAALAASALPAG
jgi:hypothetical protein